MKFRGQRNLQLLVDIFKEPVLKPNTKNCGFFLPEQIGFWHCISDQKLRVIMAPPSYITLFLLELIQ